MLRIEKIIADSIRQGTMTIVEATTINALVRYNFMINDEEFIRKYGLMASREIVQMNQEID